MSLTISSLTISHAKTTAYAVEQPHSQPNSTPSVWSGREVAIFCAGGAALLVAGTAAIIFATVPAASALVLSALPFVIPAAAAIGVASAGAVVAAIGISLLGTGIYHGANRQAEPPRETVIYHGANRQAEPPRETVPLTRGYSFSHTDRTLTLEEFRPRAASH